MDESKQVPFGRDIPHFPGEELSLGMPATPEESVFLSVPELANAAHSVVEYGAANTKARKHIEDRTVREILAQPERLAGVFDALEMLKQTGGYTKAQEFEEVIIEKLKHSQFKEFLPSTKAVYELLLLMSHSAVYSPLAEKILGNMVEGCRDTYSLVRVLYELAGVGLGSGDLAVIKKTLEVLGFQTDALPYNSQAAMMFTLSSMDKDDRVLGLSMEIQSAQALFCRIYFPVVKDVFTQKRALLYELPEYKQMAEHIGAGYDPQRFAALEKFYSQPINELGAAEIKDDEDVNTLAFPYNLVMVGGGPLRDLSNRILMRELASRGGERAVNVHLPFTNSVFKFEDGIALSQMIHDELNAKIEQYPPLEDPEYWETLSYLLPDDLQSTELLRTVSDVNEVLKEEMLYDSKYLLSPRGDHIEITDMALKKLGLRSVMYEMDPRNRRETIVTVSVGNFIYRMLLDEFFVPREVGTHTAFDLPQEGNFIQHILLSYLHEIRCYNRGVGIGEAGTSPLPGGDSEQRDGVVVSRRAFRRKLHEGENPTQGQILRAQTEYHIDIIRMNREAAARGETRRYTWVVEIDNSTPEQGPVRSQRPQATRQLKKILTDSASTPIDTSS